MINDKQFKQWLKANTSYSDFVVRDTISRVKRADTFLEWYDEEVYQFYLEHTDDYKALSTSVRSQIKKAVSLYRKYRIAGNIKNG